MDSHPSHPNYAPPRTQRVPTVLADERAPTTWPQDPTTDVDMRRGAADKHRLYLAVYDNSKASGPGFPLQIHWALLLGTKREEPASLQKTHVRYHATNRTRTGHWEYERRAVECVRSPSMLGRVFLGKVDRRDVPVLDRVLGDPRRMRPRDPRWDCWKWVEEALVDLIGMNLVQVHAKSIDLSHLLAFGQKVAVEVVTEGLDIGYGIPITVTYSGPGRIPAKILR